MRRPPRKRALLIILLTAAILVCEFTPLDRSLQDILFNFGTKRWWIDAQEPVARALFYTGPKLAIIGVGVLLAALFLAPAGWRKKMGPHGWHTDRPRLLIVLLSAGAVPAVVGALKATSGVYCPSELLCYGGFAPYLRPFAATICGPSGGHCWPAGHASGGFALLVLAHLATSERRRRVVAGSALALGWTMGLYQVFKGAHFMSHTLVTWLIAVAVAEGAGILIRRMTKFSREDDSADMFLTNSAREHLTS